MRQIILDFGTIDLTGHPLLAGAIGWLLWGLAGFAFSFAAVRRAPPTEKLTARLQPVLTWLGTCAVLYVAALFVMPQRAPKLSGYLFAGAIGLAVGALQAVLLDRAAARKPNRARDGGARRQRLELAPAVAMAAGVGGVAVLGFDLAGLTASPQIYGYGLMLVVGFLLAILLAQRRARRAGEGPEPISACGILALVGGVLGARIAFVIEQWDHFQDAPNRLAAILDVTGGGLIYYGGVLLAMACVLGYLLLKRAPVRRYLDIVAPSLMVGLAFGRAGCLLNGCCYGGPCRHDWPLAMRFPMISRPLIKLNGRDNPYSHATASPSAPYDRQYWDGKVTPDERLVNRRARVTRRRSDGTSTTRPRLLPARDLHGPLRTDQLAVLLGTDQEAHPKFDRAAGDDPLLDERDWERARRAGDGLLRGSEPWDEAVQSDGDADGLLNFAEAWDYLTRRRDDLLARFDADGDKALNEAERRAANAWLCEDLYAVAGATWSEPLRPAQALGVANALLLAGLLLAFSRLRTREGQVFALLLVAYPITRFILESIRADNPHDILAGVLTHNQWTSIATVAVALVLWVVLWKLPPAVRRGGTDEERCESRR